MPTLELTRTTNIPHATTMPTSTIDCFTEIGRRRLARVIRASLKIQGLSTRQVENVSRRWYGEPLNKNTVSSYGRASTQDLKPYTLAKLAPFLFRVVQFSTTADDPVGFPVFEQLGLVRFKVTPRDAVGTPEVPEAIKFNQLQQMNLLDSLDHDDDKNPLPLHKIRMRKFNEPQDIALELSTACSVA